MAEAGNDARRRALEAVLASEAFRRARRLRQVLRCIGEASLDGRDRDLSQKAIAHEVFGLAPGSVEDYQFVRRSVNELRKKLAIYYAGEGAGSMIRISIPGGSYQAVFEELTRPAGAYPAAQEPEDVPPPKGERPPTMPTAEIGSAYVATRRPAAAARGSMPSHRFWFLLGVAIGVVLLVAAIAWFSPRGPAVEEVPYDTSSHGNVLHALGKGGNILWSMQLEAEVHPSRLIADLDADGAPEVVAATGNTNPGNWEGILHAFRSDGREIWRVPLAPAGEIPFPDPMFRGPFWLAQLAAADLNGDGRLEVLAVARHAKWFPTRVLRIDASGTLLGSYWHPGHFFTMTVVRLPGGKKALLLGGCNNGYGRRPALVWLDPDRMNGRGPAETGSQYEARGLPLADPIAYLLLPRTEPSLRYQEIVPYVGYLDKDSDGTVRAHTLEPIQEEAARHSVVYVLDRSLRLLGTTLSDPLRVAYEEEARRKGEPRPDFQRVQENLAAQVEVWRGDRFTPLAPGETALTPASAARTR